MRHAMQVERRRDPVSMPLPGIGFRLSSLLFVLLAAGLLFAAADAIAAAADTLAVRIGRHENSARVVFEWPQPVDYRLQRNGDSVTLEFARTAKFDADRLSRNLPPQIVSLRGEAGDEGLRVTLVTASGASVHESRYGAKVVLDIAQSAPPRADAAKPAPPADAAKPASPAVNPKKMPIRLAPPSEASTRPAPPMKSGDGVGRIAQKDVVPLAAAARSAPAPTPASAPVQAAAPPSGPPPLVGVDVWRAGERIVIRFDWRSDVAAAVFARNGKMWIAFDEPARIDMGGIQVIGRNVLGGARQLPMDGASVVYAAIDGQWSAEVKRDGLAWIVELAPGPMAAADALDIRAKPGPSGLEAVVPAEESGRPLRVIDPESNDAIEVIPLHTETGAIARRSLIDFDVLASLQGIAIKPNVEKVTLRVTSSDITVSRDGGLRMSSPVAVAAHRATPNGMKPRLLNLAAWAAENEPYNAQRMKMQQAIIKANGGDKEAARFAFARFFLARGRAAEALGVLGEIVRLKPEAEATPEILALRGAAHLLQGEYGEALADLAGPKLNEVPEIEPWRAMLAAARGAWQDAFNRFEGSDGLIAQYPAWLAGRIGLVAAEAALVAKEVDVARARLAAPQIASLTGPQGYNADVLRGYLLKISGDTERAKKVWQRVAREGDRLSRAKARFAETDTLYVQGAIDVRTAIERLEKLTFAWRGDVFEFDLLNRLAALKASAQDYRGALAALRNAVSYFDSVYGAQASAAEMNEQFRRLFLDGGADAMSPIAALGLFDEFRELVPAGKDGDEMISKLADRLVAVDLLDEASSLLERQMSIRLAGVQKAEVGARLASIRLAARRPGEAIGALAGSDEPDLPDDLVHRRTLLRARAEGRLGHTEAALGLISGDASHDADAIRLEVYWKKSMWREAASVFAGWMKDADPEKLDDAKARLVLNWAVASALAGDQAGLNALRTRFAARLAAGPYSKMFKTIVGDGGAPPPDYRALAKQVADLDTLNGFMASYRDTSGKPVLSAVQ